MNIHDPRTKSVLIIKNMRLRLCGAGVTFALRAVGRKYRNAEREGEAGIAPGYCRRPLLWYQYAQWSQYLSGRDIVTRSSRSGPTN